MGADFIYSVCKVIHTEPSLFKEQVTKHIATLTNEDLEYVFMVGGDDITPPEIVDLTLVALGYLSKPYRDFSVMKFGDQEYWISGGMSWGDNPTDAYEHIELLSVIADGMATAPKDVGL